MRNRFFPVIQQNLKAMIGYVNATNPHSFFIKSYCEHRDVQMVMPFGVCTFPKNDDEVLMLQVEDKTFCLGTLHKQGAFSQNTQSTKNEKGYIRIHENGEVEINGLFITTNGTIKPKGGL